MRKITEKTVSAFLNGINISTSNTKVIDDKLYLHDNLIAYRKDGELFISNSGWQSNTTKERLNGILDLLNVGRIYQRDFVWYWKDDIEFPFNEFVKVK